MREAEETKREAEEHAATARKHSEALNALKEALINVVETEEDPDLKEGLTVQTKRFLMEIISPTKEEPELNKKPKLEVGKLELEEAHHEVSVVNQKYNEYFM